MPKGFTKLYQEERSLLRKINTGIAYEVYMHLKDKYNYFKEDCYDLTRCISEYLEMSESTIKRAIKSLKAVGLISIDKRGKANIYSFPILNKIEGTEKDLNTADYSASNDKEVEQPQPTEDMQTEGKEIAIEKEIGINNNTDNNMGTFIGDFEELKKRTITDDFTSIDRLIPKPNKYMALKQVKPYLPKEKNIGRLNDALSVFLKDVSLDDRTKYYNFILEQVFAVA